MINISETVLLARNDDGGGEWVQLLVFVVMAVIWAVGGILKAKSNKVGEDKSDEQPQPLRLNSIREMLKGPQPQKPMAPPKAPVRPRLAVQKELTPAVDLNLEEVKKVDLSVKKKQKPEPTAKSLLDFSNRDDLRRAVLHYEILGKPISLRRPQQQQ